MRKDQKINVNGISVNYEDSGKGDTCMIFIHGFPLDKSMWEHQFDFFKKKNRIITYDIRGFGKSTTNGLKASINLYAEDLIKLMDELKIEKAVVCGLSMGGYILLSAVERYPQKFKAIILSATQCVADSTEIKEKRFDTIKEIKSNGLEGFSEKLIQTIFSKGTLKKKKELVKQIKKVIVSTNPQTIMSTLEALANREEKCRTLSKITVPALILCGEEDALIPPHQSKLLTDNITQSYVETIENAGHLINLEQSEIFNEHIYAFIENI